MDITGGLGDEREYFMATRPEDSEMRDAVALWVWDSGTEVGIPRIGLDAVGGEWETPEIQGNVSLADGRVLTLLGSDTAHGPLGADGRRRVLGADALSFELIEPFRHWKMDFDGLAVDTTVENQIAGRLPDQDPSVPLEIHVDIVSAAPPWENGELLPEAKRVLAQQDEGEWMGGLRFEQLSRATGTLRVGDTTYRIDGEALRVRRQGVRRMGTFRGHVWQSALFPSGRGFGHQVYPPRDDGLATFNEAFLFDGDGGLIPAQVVEAPWLRRLEPRGEDVSVVLESKKGTTHIQGESAMSVLPVTGGIGPGTESLPVMQQSIVRYTLDGETANGMMERSMPADKLDC